MTSPIAAPSAAHAVSYENLLRVLEAALTDYGSATALLLIEINRLTELHARLGFAASADLMQTLNQRFVDALGGRGTVIRFQDGSYCALVKGIRNPGHALLAAEKIWRTMDETMTVSGVHGLAAHVGIALYPLHGSSPDELIRKAHLAAAMARKRGVRTLAFAAEYAAEVLQHWELEDAFVAALESGEIEMHYQPKVRLADSRMVGVEALMRWLREGQVVSTPDVFIPLAEEAGLTANTTWYALSNALRHATELGGIAVSINVTPAMLHHNEFMDMVQTAVSNWRIPAGSLTLEVTEGALIVDFDQAIERLSALRNLGVRISLDDFGTGYSSLSYFKKIPADELKIDKSFIQGMLQHPADHQLVATIITLARQFKLEIVAEGVEDRATAEALTAMGCHYIQGFWVAPALSFSALRDWIVSDGKRGVTDTYRFAT